MSVFQLYQRAVPLNRFAHQELRIKEDGDYGFARKCQAAILAATELSAAIKEFPVVFASDKEKYFPVALLGIEQNQNLFVDAENHWTARYIPAFIRRYPFILAQDGEKDGPLTVWIDEAAECFNRQAGEPLFLGEKNSALLNNKLQFLEDFHAQLDATAAQVKQLVDAGLISEKTAHFSLPGGRVFSLDGFLTIDTAKLPQLSQEAVFSLYQTGALSLAFLHLSSLDNLDHLLAQHAKSLASEDERIGNPAKNDARPQQTAS